MTASTALVPLGTVALACVRPFKRWQCAGHRKPCPWTNCRYHLQNMPRKAGPPSKGSPQVGCALDVLDVEPWPHTCREVALLTGLTAQRVEQVEQEAIKKLRRAVEKMQREQGEDVIGWEEFCHAVGFQYPSAFTRVETDEEQARHVNGQRLRAAIRRRG